MPVYAFAPQVYMVARNMKKLEAAAQQIRKEIGKAAQLELYQCDLTSME